MGDIIKNGGNEIVGLIHGKNGELDIPKPFQRDIFLFDTYVAGTTHVDGIEELEPGLNVGDRLDFFREPDNPYDPMAIAVKNTDGVKVISDPEFSLTTEPSGKTTSDRLP